MKNDLYELGKAFCSGGRSGRCLSNDELREVQVRLPDNLWSPDYFRFLTSVPVIRSELTIPSQLDRSGVGADIFWLDANGILTETLELYPGILLASQNYLALGACSLGTGDPYFIRILNGEPFGIVRAPHDAVFNTASAPRYQIDCLEPVADSLSELFFAAMPS